MTQTYALVTDKVALLCTFKKNGKSSHNKNINQATTRNGGK